jgi:hypothetical protein
MNINSIILITFLALPEIPSSKTYGAESEKNLKQMLTHVSLLFAVVLLEHVAASVAALARVPVIIVWMVRR